VADIEDTKERIISPTLLVFVEMLQRTRLEFEGCLDNASLQNWAMLYKQTYLRIFLKL